MYDPSNRPARSLIEQANRLRAENLQLKHRIAAMEADLKESKRKAPRTAGLMRELTKAQHQRDRAQERAELADKRRQEALGRAAAAEDAERLAREEARMCRFVIAELRSENRMLLDLRMIACA